MASSTSIMSGNFSLVDYHGNHVTEKTYDGLFRLVFFGFTHCRVVCPRNLQRLSVVLDKLGPLAEMVKPLYVSVDPVRDTPSVMKEFLSANYPRFTGLTGTDDQVASAKKSFRVFSKHKDDPDDPDGYAVPHTAITYLMGREGKYLAHFPESIGDEELLLRLRMLLSEGE